MGCTPLLQCLGRLSLLPSMRWLNEYQLSSWIIIINGNGGCGFWQPTGGLTARVVWPGLRVGGRLAQCHIHHTNRVNSRSGFELRWQNHKQPYYYYYYYYCYCCNNFIWNSAILNKSLRHTSNCIKYGWQHLFIQTTDIQMSQRHVMTYPQRQQLVFIDEHIPTDVKWLATTEWPLQQFYQIDRRSLTESSGCNMKLFCQTLFTVWCTGVGHYSKGKLVQELVLGIDLMLG